MRLLKDDLRELDLFSEASRSELAVIARQLTRLKVKAGRVLVREGGIGNEFMIMVSGMAEVTQGGREHRHHRPGRPGRRDGPPAAPRLRPAQRHGDGDHRCGDLRRLGRASSAASWRPPRRWPRRSSRRSPRGRWSRPDARRGSRPDGGALGLAVAVRAGGCPLGNHSVTVTNVLPHPSAPCPSGPSGAEPMPQRRSLRRPGRSDPPGDPAAPERGRQAGPRDRRRAADQPSRGLAPPAPAEGRGPGGRAGRGEPPDLPPRRTGECRPSRTTSRACGARRPPGSGCWPRTPAAAASP